MINIVEEVMTRFIINSIACFAIPTAITVFILTKFLGVNWVLSILFGLFNTYILGWNIIKNRQENRRPIMFIMSVLMLSVIYTVLFNLFLQIEFAKLFSFILLNNIFTQISDYIFLMKGYYED